MTISKIEWCDHSFPVVDGCSRASPGCDHCYAARLNGTRLAHLPAVVDGRAGTRGELVKALPMAGGGQRFAYNGKVALNRDRLVKLLKLPKNGGKAGRRVFLNPQSDTFHDRLANDEITAIFAAMAARPDLHFYVLTKRAQTMRAWFAWIAEQATALGPEKVTNIAYVLWSCARLHGLGTPIPRLLSWPLKNISLGVSAENQEQWDERVPHLMATPARYRFISAEPLLGPIVVRIGVASAQEQGGWARQPNGAIHQVIIGAESGPHARPAQLSWIQGLAAKVLDARVALFLKQADVCPVCAGRGIRLRQECECRGRGAAGKKRKGNPAVWIPGHGAQSWAQFPEGW